MVSSKAFEKQVEKARLQLDDDFVLSKYRWFVLFQISMAIVGSGQAMMTYSAVSTIVSEIYDVGPLTVNACVMEFLISFILFSFISVPIIEKRGLQAPVS